MHRFIETLESGSLWNLYINGSMSFKPVTASRIKRATQHCGKHWLEFFEN